MYSDEQIQKTFEQIIKFHSISAEITKIKTISEENTVIFIKETKDKIDTDTIEKELKDNLRINIEVRFLGAREKAAEIGGLGPCGKSLCCSSWLPCTPNVGNSALKDKEFSDASEYLGMCGKLRCCLVYLEDGFELPCGRQRPEIQTLESVSTLQHNAGPLRSETPASKEEKKEKSPEKKKQKFVRTLTFKPRKKK